MDSDDTAEDISSMTSDFDDQADIVVFANKIMTTFRIAFSLVFIITLVGLVANVFVLYIILRNQKLRNTVYNVYIISLCISSFLFLLVWGLTDVITYGLYLHKRIFHIHTDSKIRKFLAGSQACTMVVNCFMITALAVDRYIIVARPVQRQSWRTVKNALIVCAIVWAGGLLSACTAIPIDLFTSLKTLYTINIIFFVLTFVIPVIIIGVCFGLTVRDVASRRIACTQSATGRRGLAHQRRFLVLIGCVSLSFFVCWGYWHGYYLAIWPLFINGRFYRSNVLVHISLHILTDVLVLFNTALNPILYALNRPHIKRHLASFFTCGLKSRHGADMADGIESTGTDSVTHSDGAVTFNVADEAVADEPSNTPPIN